MSIEIKNIAMHYGKLTALDGISLTFQPNRIYGLLGRNGAGKTTLLNILTNRLFAQSGEVLVDGEAAQENDRALRKIFMMGEQTLYPEGMRVKEAINWTAKFYPGFDKAFAKQLCEEFKLNTNKSCKSLSTGYLSIFKLVLALSVNTPYVIFDEPVLGLDAGHRELFYQHLLTKYSENPFTVILSTHLIEEVSNLVEHIFIIDKGRLLEDADTEALLEKGYTVSGKAEAVDRFTEGKKILSETSLGGMKVRYMMGDRPTVVPEGLEISKLDLQKLFVKLTEEKGGAQ